MKILAFTVSRANTSTRGKLLLNTIAQARDTAGYDFDWHLHCQKGTLAEGIGMGAILSGHLQEMRLNTQNRGQHPPFNESLSFAKVNDYDFLLRLDDDCEFITKRWLAKLIEISAAFDHKALLTPAVKGLKYPPPRSLEVEVGGFPVELLTDAIGGICRLHPVSVLVEGHYQSDVRLPLGSGDASGIGAWCNAQFPKIIPMVWCKSVRVRHTTKEQENLDGEHFILHNLFQRLPYIPNLEP